jgi:hypothetical protein
LLRVIDPVEPKNGGPPAPFSLIPLGRALPVTAGAFTAVGTGFRSHVGWLPISNRTAAGQVQTWSSKPAAFLRGRRLPAEIRRAAIASTDRAGPWVSRLHERWDESGVNRQSGSGPIRENRQSRRSDPRIQLAT